jgi:mono/diheme cytochrome c family protein
MKKSVTGRAAFSLAALFYLVASAGADDLKKAATFTKDVAPILFKNCAACHRPGNIGPMSLVTYREVRPWARSIKEKVIKREMPPWGADPRHGEFSNDPRLSEQEIATIAAWVDQGGKEGDPRHLPPLPRFADRWEIGAPDAVIAMQREWEVAAAGPDDNIEFSVPTGFTEDRWVQAVEFRPGNRRAIHHAVVLIQTPEMIRAGETGAPATAAERVVARVDPAIYDSYVGEYQVGSRTCSVIRGGDGLWLVAPGWMKAEALPESETKFYLRAMDAQMSFVRNEKGEVTGFLFEMGNRTMQAKKIK